MIETCAIQLPLTVGAVAATIPAQVIQEWTGATHAYLSASIVRAGKASVCIPTGISRLSQDVNPADIAGHRVRFAWFETAARHVQGEQQGITGRVAATSGDYRHPTPCNRHNDSAQAGSHVEKAVDATTRLYPRLNPKHAINGLVTRTLPAKSATETS